MDLNIKPKTKKLSDPALSEDSFDITWKSDLGEKRDILNLNFKMFSLWKIQLRE